MQKLEALYSQHQRAQYKRKDRLKWLKSTDDRLAKAEEAYNENIRLSDANTRTIKDNGKEKIKLELGVGACVLYVKDSEKIKDQLLSGVMEVIRISSAKVEFGKYLGFEVFVERTGRFSGTDGFRLCIKGADGHEFRPANLASSFDGKFSLTGLFQRMDNFLAKGQDEWIGSQREKTSEERGELETIMAAMGEDDNYVSSWEPKKLEQSAPVASEPANSTSVPQLPVDVILFSAREDSHSKQILSCG